VQWLFHTGSSRADRPADLRKRHRFVYLCVIHGDPHVGNVVLDGSGQPLIIDWQTVQRGAWYVDVGYHLASALTVSDRRRTERDLLRHYLGELAARGIDVPSFDDAFAATRHGILHGFYMWAITIHVAPPIIAALLHRLGTAVADHNALERAFR
jgi:aminoglycoside phosphotransferase (APT) family kinase protein